MRRVFPAAMVLALVSTIAVADMYQNMSNVTNPVVSGIKSIPPGSILPDPGAWGSSYSGYNANLEDPTGAGGNRFILNIQGGAETTTTTGPGYERAGLLIQTYTRDPSSGARNLDMVGLDTRGRVMTPNMQGRAWGLFSSGRVDAGSDGYALAAEMSLENFAALDQPNHDTTTSKYIMHLMPAGTQNVTGGIYFGEAAGSAARLHCGLCIKAAAIGTAPNDRAIWVGTPGSPEYFAVSRDGTVKAAGIVLPVMLGSCSGAAPGTLWNNAGVVNVCP
jgi:hypothetical protein